MLACILFVFGALVEYAAILFNRQTVPEEEVRRIKSLPHTYYYKFSASPEGGKMASRTLQEGVILKNFCAFGANTPI